AWVFAVEESVNRSIVIIGVTSVLALVLAVLMIGRGDHPTLAARTSTESAVASAAPPAPPLPSVNKPAEASPIPSRSEGPAESTAAPPPPQAAALEVDPHEALGSKTAPIVMEVFSDFQCPACKTLFVTTNRPLMDNYVSTSKVYLIHRDFPLP